MLKQVGKKIFTILRYFKTFEPVYVILVQVYHMQAVKSQMSLQKCGVFKKPSLLVHTRLGHR